MVALCVISPNMKISKEILIGIALGVFIGLPQGLRDLPQSESFPKSEEIMAGVAGIGCIFGFFLGMHLLSRANPDPKKHGAYAGFVVGSLCIGVPTIIRHFDGSLLQSINIVAALFTALGVAMIFGGVLGGIASKNT